MAKSDTVSLVTISAASCPGHPWIEFAARITPGSTPAAPIDLPRLRTSRNLTLLSVEGGQDLLLLAPGHLELIQGVDQFLGDFVEYVG